MLIGAIKQMYRWIFSVKCKICYLCKKVDFYLLNDEDDHDYDDDELLLWYGRPTTGLYSYFQPAPFSEILTIANLRHAESRI